MGESDAMDTSKAEDAPKKGPQVSLEELFDHDDEDDEFSSSMLATNGRDEPPSSSPPPIPSCVDSTLTQTVLTVPFRIIESAPQYSDPDIMLAFYQRLFPFKSLFQWLNHSMKPSNDTANREIAFTLANEAYLRYQSYPTAEAYFTPFLPAYFSSYNDPLIPVLLPQPPQGRPPPKPFSLRNWPHLHHEPEGP